MRTGTTSSEGLECTGGRCAVVDNKSREMEEARVLIKSDVSYFDHF